MKLLRACAAVASTVGAFGLLTAGCYSNVATMFPDGFEPWEEQMSEPAAATAGDPCPEMPLVHVESHTWQSGHVASVHASACIHAPITEVWRAMRDPESGHDPTVNTWTVFPEPVAGECAGLFETGINAGSPVSVDFRLCWRYALVSGTEAAPTVVVSRWQKVFGTSAISTLEGTLVASQFPGDPDNITIVDYQYHLSAATTGPSNYQTINEYLDTIYGRLRHIAHGEAP
jgi:hypothetical protein